jgi:hypothetical protein
VADVAGFNDTKVVASTVPPPFAVARIPAKLLTLS